MLKSAQEWRVEGNKFFQRKDYPNALNYYTQVWGGGKGWWKKHPKQVLDKNWTLNKLWWKNLKKIEATESWRKGAEDKDVIDIQSWFIRVLLVYYMYVYLFVNQSKSNRRSRS